MKSPILIACDFIDIRLFLAVPKSIRLLYLSALVPSFASYIMLMNSIKAKVIATAIIPFILMYIRFMLAFMSEIPTAISPTFFYGAFSIARMIFYITKMWSFMTFNPSR
jgi:hypothetical protein